MIRSSLVRRALVATTATLVLLPLGAGAAAAASLTAEDGAGDMWTFSDESTADSEEPFVAAPDHTNGDVLRTTWSVGAKRVSVTAKFVDLDDSRGDYFLLTGMKAPDGRKHVLSLITDRRHSAGQTYLETWRAKQVNCPIRHRVDYDRNVMRVSFPHACIGSPRALQFRAWNYHATRKNLFLDNPQTDQVDSRRWTDRVRRG